MTNIGSSLAFLKIVFLYILSFFLPIILRILNLFIFINIKLPNQKILDGFTSYFMVIKSKIGVSFQQFLFEGLLELAMRIGLN